MDSSAGENLARTGAEDVEQRSKAAVWIERAIIFWLFAFAISAPHSIAATQSAWLVAMLLWTVRHLIRPRPTFKRTPIDYALLGFFILTLVSSLFSYDQAASMGKLRAASLFTIVYLVSQNVASRKVLRWLILALIASAMVSVVYTVGERIVGRGIRVEGVAQNSPLRSAVFINAQGVETPTPIQSGDTILEVQGRALGSLEELTAALEAASDTESVLVKIYRVEWTPVLRIPRGQLLEGETMMARLGVESFSRGREWRAAGFYGHYTTYAEAMQLIASLALGVFITLREKRSLTGALLLVALAGLGGALLLTVTRASWLALLLSAFVIVIAGASRRTALILAACALPLIIAGLLVLQQQRSVGFYDQKDQSIVWRETVWREGLELLVSKPRHLLVGVGMDSIKSHWREWGLFDKGRLPIGHMHSTPLQLAVERGVPTLLLWVVLVAAYAGMLWRVARKKKSSTIDEWERGLTLGALGGLTGFVVSGMVHYNFGDSEVVMIFYFIMGLSLVVEREARKEKTASSMNQPETA